MRAKDRSIPNEQLRAARLARSWTLAAAAEKANVSLEAYSRWEYGLQEPRLSSLLLLCKGFEMTAEDLGFGHLVKPTKQQETTETEEKQSPVITLQLTPQQITALSSLLQGDSTMKFDPTRRKLLADALAAAGVAVAMPLVAADTEPWERLTKAYAKPSAMNTEAFRRFERLLTESWELSNLNELEAAEGIVSSFLPKITAIPPRQITAQMAYLASQGLRLQSVLIHHRLRIADKIQMCELSVEYARYADDANTLVAALIELADAYEFDGQMDKCLRTLQESLHYSAQASPLVQSRAYSNNAIILAASGRKKEAELYIDLAHDVFPDNPALDLGYALADSSVFTLSYHTGLARLDTDQVSAAPEGFEFYKMHPSGTAIPERLRLEIVNGLSKAAIRAENLEQYIYLFEDALTGAAALGSKKRFDEAVRLFQNELPKGWSTHNQVKEIIEKYGLEG